MIEARIDAELRLKQEKEQMKITDFTANIINAAKNIEKELINQLEMSIAEKRKHLL